MGLGFQFWQGKEIFLFLKMLRPAGAHPASCSVGTRVFLGVKQAGMKLTTYLHLVPILSMSGAIPLLLLICLHGVERQNFTINCLSQLDQLVVIYRVMFHHNVGRCHWEFQIFQFLSEHNLVNRHIECLQFHYLLYCQKKKFVPATTVVNERVQLNVSGRSNLYHLIIQFWWSRSSVHWIFTSHWGAGVAMMWGLDPIRGKRFISSLEHPDLLWGPPNVLFNGYWGV
jgi:hypothetical protein